MNESAPPDNSENTGTDTPSFPSLPTVSEHSAAGESGSTAFTDVLPRSTDPSLFPIASPPRVPGYEIVGELGRGGMGVVYQARQLLANRTVAIKVILSGGYAGDSDKSRFQSEARALGALHHPNIVQVYEVGEHEGLPFFSLEYCSKGSLSRALDGTPLPPQVAARLAEHLSRAVAAAHSAGIVHRDLKPSNVLLAADGTPKIADFGLAKRSGDEGAETRSNAVMGTPSYMAPEQALGRSRDVGPAADLYSLGAILYELLTGRPPFKGTSTLETLEQVRTQEPPAPRVLQPSVPRDLETICLKCLEKDSANRYPSAEALAEDLCRYNAGKPVLARPVGRTMHLWRWCQRNRGVAILAGLLLATLVGGLAGLTALYFHAEQQRSQAVEFSKAAALAQEQAEVNAKTAETRRVEAVKQRELTTREAEKAQAVTRFLLNLFEASDPLGINGFTFSLQRVTGEKLTARQLLDRGAERLASKQELPLPVRQTLNDAIGNVYRSLGHHEQAEKLLTEALTARRADAKGDPLELAATAYNLGWLRHERGRYDDAMKLYREALDLRRQHAPKDELLAASTELNIAWLAYEMEDFEQAERLLKNVIEIRRRHLGEKHRETASAKAGLAGVYIDSYRILPALVLIKDSIAVFQETEGKSSLGTALGLMQLALAQQQLLGKAGNAESMMKECVRLTKEALGSELHIYTALTVAMLGSVQKEQGKLEAAAASFREAAEIVRATVGLDHPRVSILYMLTGQTLIALNRKDEEKQFFDEVLAAHRRRYGPDHVLVGDLFVGRVVAVGEERAAIAENLREALRIYRKAGGPPRRMYAAALNRMGKILMNEGRHSEAVAHFRECLPLLPRPNLEEPSTSIAIRGNLANALMSTGDFGEEVERLIAEARSKLGGLAFGSDARSSRAIVRLAAQRLHLHYERWDEALADLSAFRKEITWLNSSATWFTSAQAHARAVAALDAAKKPPANAAEMRSELIGYSFQSLQKAAELGFKDVAQVEASKEFAILKERPEYRKAIESMRNGKKSQ